jgi:hypothetical protein
MIYLSHEARRHLRADPEHLYALRDRRAAMLNEARRVAERDDLSAWRPEAETLVATLAAQLASDAAKIATFEENATALETAAHEELVALHQLERAKAVHALGSLDRDEALRLRDDIEFAASRARVIMQDCATKARAASAGLPSTSNLQPDQESAAIVEAIASWILGREFHPSETALHIERSRYERFLASAETAVMWIPLHAARTLDETLASRTRRQLRDPATGRWYSADSRRVEVIMDEKKFLEALFAFKAQRAAQIRGKVATAAAELEAAKTRMASLEGQASL